MRIRRRFLTRLLARFAVWAMRLLFTTCRRVYVIESPDTNPYRDTGDKRHLFCIWHDQIVMTLFSGRPRNMAGLVSPHTDGGYVADAMEFSGIAPVRGSSSRGGARAMRELLEKAEALHVAITPDGPRGPRREAKSGIVYLASQTGRQIVPVAYHCKRCWQISGSWTDMMIPKPFTKIHAFGGRPLSIPSDLDKDGLRLWTETLQQEMQRAERITAGLAAGRTLEELVAEEDVVPSAQKAA